MSKVSIINDEISDQVDEFLLFLKNQNLKNIELRNVNGKNILDFTIEEARDLSKILQVNKINVTCLASPILKWYPNIKFSHNKQVDTFGFSKVVNNKERKILYKKIFQLADVFDVRYIRIFSFLKYRGFKIEHLYKELDELLLLAKKYNKILLLENEPACNIHTVQQLVKILSKYNSKNLRGLLDIGNIYKEGHIINEHDIETVAPLIDYAHIKDFSFSEKKYVSLGQGNINYKKHLSQLNKFTNNNIIYSLETHTGENKYNDSLNSYKKINDLLINKKKSIKYGLVGCGQIHSKHVDAIRQNDNSILMGVFDIDETKARHAAKYSDSINFASSDVLIDQVDVVIICTPHDVIEKYIELILKKNKKCLCEKPVLLKYSSKVELRKKSNRYNANVFVVFQNRYRQVIKKLKEVVVTKQLGELRYISGIIHWPRNDKYYQNPWRGNKKREGGILFNQGIHMIDIIFFLLNYTNEKINILYSHKETIVNKVETEDLFTSAFYIKNIFCNIEVNTAKHLNQSETDLTLIFERGVISLGGKSFDQIKYIKSDNTNLNDSLLKTNDKDSYIKNAHLPVIENLSSILLSKKPNQEFPVYKDAVKLVSFIQELYKSVK